MNEMTIDLDVELDLATKDKCTSTDLAQRVIDALVGMQQSFGGYEETPNDNRPYCGAHVNLDNAEEFTNAEVDTYETHVNLSRTDRVRLSDVFAEGNQAALTALGALKEKISTTLANDCFVEVEASKTVPDSKFAVLVPPNNFDKKSGGVDLELSLLRQEARLRKTVTRPVDMNNQKGHLSERVSVWGYALNRVCDSMAYGRPLTTV